MSRNAYPYQNAGGMRSRTFIAPGYSPFTVGVQDLVNDSRTHAVVYRITRYRDQQGNVVVTRIPLNPALGYEEQENQPVVGVTPPLVAALDSFHEDSVGAHTRHRPPKKKHMTSGQVPSGQVPSGQVPSGQVQVGRGGLRGGGRGGLARFGALARATHGLVPHLPSAPAPSGAPPSSGMARPAFGSPAGSMSTPSASSLPIRLGLGRRIPPGSYGGWGDLGYPMVAIDASAEACPDGYVTLPDGSCVDPSQLDYAEGSGVVAAQAGAPIPAHLYGAPRVHLRRDGRAAMNIPAWSFGQNQNVTVGDGSTDDDGGDDGGDDDYDSVSPAGDGSTDDDDGSGDYPLDPDYTDDGTADDTSDDTDSDSDYSTNLGSGGSTTPYPSAVSQGNASSGSASADGIQANWAAVSQAILQCGKKWTAANESAFTNDYTQWEAMYNNVASGSTVYNLQDLSPWQTLVNEWGAVIKNVCPSAANVVNFPTGSAGVGLIGRGISGAPSVPGLPSVAGASTLIIAVLVAAGVWILWPALSGLRAIGV